MTQVTIRRRGFWPFRFWEVREVGSKVFADFDSREQAVSYALDLAGGDNRLVTVNGRALDDG